MQNLNPSISNSHFHSHLPATNSHRTSFRSDTSPQAILLLHTMAYFFRGPFCSVDRHLTISAKALLVDATEFAQKLYVAAIAAFAATSWVLL